jgi:hypothetical protein
LDEFDEMLVGTVDRVIKCSLGEENARIVFEYLAKKSCSLMEIPQNLSLFSLELRKVLDSDESRLNRLRANVQGSVEVIEETIIRMLCLQIARTGMKLGGIRLGELCQATFAEYITKFKEAYLANRASQKNHEALGALTASALATNGGENT